MMVASTALLGLSAIHHVITLRRQEFLPVPSWTLLERRPASPTTCCRPVSLSGWIAKKSVIRARLPPSACDLGVEQLLIL